MKTIHTILLLSLTALLLTSCVREEEVAGRQNEQAVMITLGAESRAGDASGDLADHYINSLRILGYRTSDGTLAFNKMALGLPAVSDNLNEIERKIEVITGKFTIVLIANEHSEVDSNTNGISDLSELLNGITATNNNKISYLQGLSFSHLAFDTSKNIPMVAIKENIIIQGDDMLVEEGVSYTKWGVVLTRIGIRVDVKLKLTDAQMDDWQMPTVPAHSGRVYFNNVPEKAYIFPGIDNSDVFVADYTKYAAPTPATIPVDGDGLNVFVCQRIILPETNSPTLDKPQALTIKVMENNIWRTGTLTSSPSVYTLPRNYYIDVTATMPVSDTEITITSTVTPWDDISIPIDDLEGP